MEFSVWAAKPERLPAFSLFWAEESPTLLNTKRREAAGTRLAEEKAVRTAPPAQQSMCVSDPFLSAFLPEQPGRPEDTPSPQASSESTDHHTARKILVRRRRA
jgi:hypothetical protein